MPDIELIPDFQLVKDIECIKNLTNYFRDIQERVYPNSEDNSHKTFLQLVHDSSLIDPKELHYNMSLTYPNLVEKIQVIEYELANTVDNLPRVRQPQMDKVELQKTMQRAEIALDSAARYV